MAVKIIPERRRPGRFQLNSKGWKYIPLKDDETPVIVQFVASALGVAFNLALFIIIFYLASVILIGMFNVNLARKMMGIDNNKNSVIIETVIDNEP